MGDIRVAVVGVGNCASSLIQGTYFYRSVKPEEDVPGLMHVDFGGYHPRDLKFVAAFDVDVNKVGKDLAEAIHSKPNNAPVFSEVPRLGVEVKRGPVLDGLGKYLKKVIKVGGEEVQVAEELRKSKAEILVNYVPVGSEKAARFYAQAAMDAGCAFVNCMPTFIASSPDWQGRFEKSGLPVAGDDIMSQLGATVLHKTIMKLLVDRGIKIEESYQLNVGGDMDFYNMIDEDRLKTKRESKTSAVQSLIPYPVPLHIGPSDYVGFLENTKICYIWARGKYFGGTPVKMDVKLEVVDSPNSAGVAIDAIRASKLALDRGIAGPLVSVSAFCFKHPPVQAPYEEAKKWTEDFISGSRER